LGRGNKQEIIIKSGRFLSAPRLHHYVRRLDLVRTQALLGDLPPEAAVLLLGKLTNLIALTVDTGQKYCGKIFENCTFQLPFLFSGFTFDGDFAAFLKNQPPIVEWRRTSVS
jgi:hypothetical protein